jgi:isopentenyldiphosphate isomerase
MVVELVLSLFVLCCCLYLQVNWNHAEVSEVQFIELADLKAQMHAEPDKFTEWFRDEMQLLNYFAVPENN